MKNTIVIDGVPYERLFEDTASIDLEFTDEEYEKIETAARIGGFVSIGEFIRHALRVELERLKRDEKQKLLDALDNAPQVEHNHD